MADGKKGLLFAGIGLGCVLVIGGIAVRSWLKAKIVESGSPSGFAVQTAMSGLDKKLSENFRNALTQDERQRLEQVILRIRNNSVDFDMSQTMRLFEIIKDFDRRTKQEGGNTSHQTATQLLANLESLCPNDVRQEPQKR